MYFFFYFPVGLDRSVGRRPVLSLWLMTVFTVAFLWLHYLPWLFSFSPWNLVYFPGLNAPWTLMTAVFMHNGWAHLLGNLVYFWVFAPALESRLGAGRFLLYFLLWGTAGNLVHGWVATLGLLGQGGLGVMGASGAIAGMMGYSLLRMRDARIDIAWWILAPLVGQNRAGRTGLPLFVGVVAWIAWQVIQASLAGFTGSTVSFGAHLGGFGMGLIMAAMLGAGRDGRVEALLARGQKYMREGAFFAAAGEFTRYLEMEPGSRVGKLELARTLHLVEQKDEACRLYREVFRQDLEAGNIPALLEDQGEWRRQCGPEAMSPQELSRTAHYQEVALDDEGALETYCALHRTYPEHTLGQRALVRIIVLASGKVSRPELAGNYLDLARRALPPGSWRDFLEREFSLSAGSGADPGQGRVPAVPAG